MEHAILIQFDSCICNTGCRVINDQLTHVVVVVCLSTHYYQYSLNGVLLRVTYSRVHDPNSLWRGFLCTGQWGGDHL